MNSRTDSPRTDAAPPGAPEAVPSVRVGELLTILAKGVRAHQMYQANNPVYQRFVEAARAAFARTWEDLPQLRFTVEERGLVWDGQIFPMGEGRESLAFRFYKDGVRYLTFLPGFEDELEQFLDLVHRARLLGPEEDDLVTLLWEKDFQAFQYGYVDVLAEGLEIPEPPTGWPEPVVPGVISTDLSRRSAAEEGPTSATAPAAAQSFTHGDFKETLYFLEEDELQRLQAELEDEWERDLKADVLNALFDRLEDPIPNRQLEVLSILRQLLPVFLSRGDMVSVALMLRELDTIVQRGSILDGERRDEAERLFYELSDPVVLGQLVQSLEDGGIDPASEDLSLFLVRLRPAALQVLIRAMETIAVAAVKERLQPAVARLAHQHPDHVIELLDSPDRTVVLGAARLAGWLRLTQAAPRLVELLDRAEPSGRLAALEALAAIRSSTALEAMQRALEDEAREVRIAAARALASLRYQPARSRLERLVEGKVVRVADLTEKLAFFEAYAAVGGGEAVALLDRLLNGRGVLGRRQSPEIRACAATALGRVGTPAARAALERSADDPEAVVRSAVLRALRQEVPAP